MSSIAYYYRIKGLISPTEDKQVQLYMKGLKRDNLGKPVKQAQPMTVAILKALRGLLTENANLVTWRTVWRAHVEFLLILRFDDVKRIKREHLTFESNENGPFIRMKLQGKKHKKYNCDTNRQHVLIIPGGKTVMTEKKKMERYIMPNPNTEACLYNLTQRYLSFLEQHDGSLQPTCLPGFPNRPHPSRAIGYSLALSDLRTVSPLM